MPNWGKSAHDAAAIAATQAVVQLAPGAVGRGLREGRKACRELPDGWENGDPLLNEETKSAGLAQPNNTELRCDCCL